MAVMLLFMLMAVSKVAPTFLAVCDACSYPTVTNFDGADGAFVGMSCWSDDDDLYLVLIELEFVLIHPDLMSLRQAYIFAMAFS